MMETISHTEWLAGILLGLALFFGGVWLLWRLLRERGEGANQPSMPADPFRRFPRHTRIIVDVVFPGEYRIIWEYEKVIAIAGTPKYFPFWEALERTEAWFGERFPDAIRGEDVTDGK